MIGATHLYGGFRIPPSLAARVFEAVGEIHARNLDATLSHTSDDGCDLCRAAQLKENANDAARADQPGRQWTA